MDLRGDVDVDVDIDIRLATGGPTEDAESGRTTRSSSAAIGETSPSFDPLRGDSDDPTKEEGWASGADAGPPSLDGILVSGRW